MLFNSLWNQKAALPLVVNGQSKNKWFQAGDVISIFAFIYGKNDRLEGVLLTHDKGDVISSKYRVRNLEPGVPFEFEEVMEWFNIAWISNADLFKKEFALSEVMNKYPYTYTMDRYSSPTFRLRKSLYYQGKTIADLEQIE